MNIWEILSQNVEVVLVIPPLFLFLLWQKEAFLCPDNVLNLGKTVQFSSACSGGYLCVISGISSSTVQFA